MYITLATRRDNVDYINDKKLAELPGDPVTFHGEIMRDFPDWYSNRALKSFSLKTISTAGG